MDNIILAGIFLVLGWAIGRTNQQPEQTEQERDKDFAYYKNLSESLKDDVRRLRSEIRTLKNRN